MTRMVQWKLTGVTAAFRETLDKRRGTAVDALGKAVLASCDPYVPYRTGRLARSGTASGGIVSWTAPYAHDCYYANRPFRREVHPLAVAGWFEAAKAVDLEIWRRKVADTLGNGQKGGE